jgi:hypothetical protein
MVRFRIANSSHAGNIFLYATPEKFEGSFIQNDMSARHTPCRSTPASPNAPVTWTVPPLTPRRRKFEGRFFQNNNLTIPILAFCTD